MTYSHLRQRAQVNVLFDEAHQQAWSIRPTMAARMRPERPSDASYQQAARLLSERDFAVRVNETAALTEALLAGTDVLVVAHPSDPQWERTTGSGSPLFSRDETDAVRAFVEAGGALVVLAEYEQAKYGTNLDELLAPFGIAVTSTTVYDYADDLANPTWVLGSPVAGRPAGLFDRVGSARFYRAGALTTTSPHATVAVRARASAAPAEAALVATAELGRGRVVVFADSDLFGDDCLAEFDNAAVWLDAFYWAALPRFDAATPGMLSAAGASPFWARLKAATSQLRARQATDGSVDLTRHDAGTVAALVDEMVTAVTGLAPLFAHQSEQLALVAADLEAWAAAGYGRPDFGRSLAAFGPELTRVDGIEHLIVFPMYTPNGSLDTRFEALIVRVPWPQWLAEIEASGYDNPKFVPVHLVDNTAGYDSECAVLFPETVSVAGPATNTFGGIFCDREAERFQRVVGRSADLLGLTLPPELRALLGSQPLLRDTFELWDLVHDRAHSHGDLPFDPFMIRQRLPYWMYALEELRCDLTAFAHAGDLVQQGFPFARYVRYCVLFDRTLRFPVTGTRVRNYDGLGGQLLFAFLHQRGVMQWRDNTLRVDWARLDEGVAALRQRIEELYRKGIDLSRVSYWIAAHDLISEFVQPNVASQWLPQRRDGLAESDPKVWIARVDDDEFPLSLFYRGLQQKLAAVGDPAVVRSAA